MEPFLQSPYSWQPGNRLVSEGIYSEQGSSHFLQIDNGNKEAKEAAFRYENRLDFDAQGRSRDG